MTSDILKAFVIFLCVPGKGVARGRGRMAFVPDPFDGHRCDPQRWSVICPRLTLAYELLSC